MTTHPSTHVITGPEAAERARISYRQLDHWARKGWVTPSVQSGSGRGGRRLYGLDDVLRLVGLRHFAQCGWPVAELGPQLAEVKVANADWLVVGSATGLHATDSIEELLEVLSVAERFSVCALNEHRSELAARFAPATESESIRIADRRSA